MLPNDLLSVNVLDNKYTVVQDSEGNLYALIYGEKWRDCTCDNLIFALAQEVDTLRQKITEMQRVNNHLVED